MSVSTKKQRYETALKNYRIASQKLIRFYREHDRMLKEEKDSLDSLVTFDDSETYYITPNGVMKHTNGSTDASCPDLATNTYLNNKIPRRKGNMMNLTLDYSENTERDDSVYFIKGSPLRPGQPCDAFNEHVSVNLPDPPVSDKFNTCAIIDSRTMMEHSDIDDLDSCGERAGDLSHDSYGMSYYNPVTQTGKCYTGNNNNIDFNGIIQEKSENVVYSEEECKLTLLKNGNLIMWTGDSFMTDDNELSMSAVKWTSATDEGSTDSSCHAIYGGTINKLDVTYGANCKLK